MGDNATMSSPFRSKRQKISTLVAEFQMPVSFSIHWFDDVILVSSYVISLAIHNHAKCTTSRYHTLSPTRYWRWKAVYAIFTRTAELISNADGLR